MDEATRFNQTELKEVQKVFGELLALWLWPMVTAYIHLAWMLTNYKETIMGLFFFFFFFFLGERVEATAKTLEGQGAQETFGKVKPVEKKIEACWQSQATRASVQHCCEDMKDEAHAPINLISCSVCLAFSNRSLHTLFAECSRFILLLLYLVFRHPGH